MIPLSYRISANLLLLRALTQRTDAVVENLTDQLRIASEETPLTEIPSPAGITVSPAFVVGVVVALGAVLYLARRRRRIR